MSLSHTIYASQATRPFQHFELDALVERCNVRNRATGVSGLLSYGGGYFLQVLEGETDVVAETFDRISKDDRHTDIVVIEQRPILARAFDDWGMFAINLDVVHREGRGFPGRKYPEEIGPFPRDPRLAFAMMYDFAAALRLSGAA